MDLPEGVLGKDLRPWMMSAIHVFVHIARKPSVPSRKGNLFFLLLGAEAQSAEHYYSDLIKLT